MLNVYEFIKGVEGVPKRISKIAERRGGVVTNRLWIIDFFKSEGFLKLLFRTIF